MRAVLELAGQEAKQDFRRGLPGVLCLAALFRPFAPLARSITEIATGVLRLMAVLGGLAWLLMDRSQPGLRVRAPGDHEA